jgi:hypothetical protein
MPEPRVSTFIAEAPSSVTVLNIRSENIVAPSVRMTDDFDRRPVQLARVLGEVALLK